MIEKNNLKGVQLIATDAWQSDVCQNYAINGIPRFMLFDTEGNVLNLNAPRPNSEEIREIFNELTNESIIETPCNIGMDCPVTLNFGCPVGRMVLF